MTIYFPTTDVMSVPIQGKNDMIFHIEYSPELGVWIEPDYMNQEASALGRFEETIICRVPPYAKIESLSSTHFRAAVAFPIYKQYIGSGVKSYKVDPNPLFNVVLRCVEQKATAWKIVSVRHIEEGFIETVVALKQGGERIFRSSRDLKEYEIRNILHGGSVAGVEVL